MNKLVRSTDINFCGFFIVLPTGLEPVISSVKGRCPNQLDGGSKNARLSGLSKNLKFTRCDSRAIEGAQTLDPNFGRVMLYRLSYYRKNDRKS